MIEIFKSAVQQGASDIHIKGGDVVRARIKGELVPITKQRLAPEQARALAQQLISNPDDRERIDDISDYDTSWGAPGIGRFRVNILKQRGSYGIVLRTIPFQVPTLDELGLPSVLKRLAESERGMVLVTGVTGSGKSTTLAAMINHINAKYKKHIITLEDPIEFLHRENLSSITQREIGQDTASFNVGLRAALREDPDVVLVGEMRDTETIDIALKASETGHLVLSTVHTTDASRTISRLVSVFNAEEQQMVRLRLADSLKATVSQRLLPKVDNKGRVVALEIMVQTKTVQEYIREDRANELKDVIEKGRDTYGTQSFDQHLSQLYRQGVITLDTARGAATNPADFQRALEFE